MDHSERLHRQYEPLRPHDGRPQLHLQLHPHEGQGVGLRRLLLHHQQLHRHRHGRGQRSQPHGHVYRQVLQVEHWDAVGVLLVHS